MKRKDNKQICFMCQQLKVCEESVKPKNAPTRYYCHSCIGVLHEIWRMRDREKKEETTV